MVKLYHPTIDFFEINVKGFQNQGLRTERNELNVPLPLVVACLGMAMTGWVPNYSLLILCVIVFGLSLWVQCPPAKAG
jgi:hypothetical protein